MLLLRRVLGASMAPTLRAGQLIIGLRLYRTLLKNDIVIVQHNGLEKIKRITNIVGSELEIQGDNSKHSTDSRHFGRVSKKDIIAKVIWPLHVNR